MHNSQRISRSLWRMYMYFEIDGDSKTLPGETRSIGW